MSAVQTAPVPSIVPGLRVDRVSLAPASASPRYPCRPSTRPVFRLGAQMSDVERGVRRLDTVQLRDLCFVLGTDLTTFSASYETALKEE
ncbi:hypothetical protein EGM97_22000 [Pseudomonas sp. AF32]|nr:hypothetical protein [Pseudomonas sp. AF32]